MSQSPFQTSDSPFRPMSAFAAANSVGGDQTLIAGIKGVRTGHEFDRRESSEQQRRSRSPIRLPRSPRVVNVTAPSMSPMSPKPSPRTPPKVLPIKPPQVGLSSLSAPCHHCLPHTIAAALWREMRTTWFVAFVNRLVGSNVGIPNLFTVVLP